MLGILAQLAKAAKLAQTAEAAIEVASTKFGKPGPAETQTRGDLIDPIPAAYRTVIEAGGLDVRQLLTLDDAAALVEKPIRRTALSVEGQILACDYHCADQVGTVLGIHVPLDERWHSIDSALPKMEVFADLGDAAFRSGREIYVKSGVVVFWIHTAGGVMVAQAVDAARLVLSRIQGA